MLEIVQKENPVLRKKARPVVLSEITSKRITDVIKNMSEALAQEEDGVAIAAPQIGESLRIFVVAGKVLSENYPDLKENEIVPANLICINPEIVRFSKQKKKMAEGCLSVRWLYGKVNRSTKVTLKAYDEHGKAFTRGASGLLAQIFQHETDHLDGILFTDSAEELEDSPPENAEVSKK